MSKLITAIKSTARTVLPSALHQRVRRTYELLSYPPLAVPPGHYYSPVVDPVEAKRVIEKREGPMIGPSIDLDFNRMTALWDKLVPLIKHAPWSTNPSANLRYYYDNGFYPYGDAVILLAMLLYHRASTLVEIGSGFSSAVTLDTHALFGVPLHLKFIDPNADRLRSLMKPGDDRTAAIIDKKIQDVDLGLFSTLKPDDIVIIDSSHVLKTGSDVHTILFEILPLLPPGVLIHFHDIFWPFEYPEDWIIEKQYSWNEIYAVRAFLMYNTEFQIEFFNDAFSKLRSGNVLADLPSFEKAPGASLWLRKIGECR